MPHYRTWFPSKYLCAEDLQGQVVPVRIVKITQEEMPNGGEKKPVLYFEGCTKGMVCNATNGKRIAGLHGVDTDDWIGKEILLYPSEADLRGETVPCVRVKQDAVLRPPTTAPVAQQEPATSPLATTLQPEAGGANGGNARPRF